MEKVATGNSIKLDGNVNRELPQSAGGRRIEAKP
jgi:hypothetical protein